MVNFRRFGKICGAIGVTMSAMQLGLIPLLSHPLDTLYVSVQTGIIALGVYASHSSDNGKGAS